MTIAKPICRVESANDYRHFNMRALFEQLIMALRVHALYLELTVLVEKVAVYPNLALLALSLIHI